MPAVIYLFSLCTFAFGLSEFVLAGLVSVMADDLHAPVAEVGSAIAAYALGAAIGAPILTALAHAWSDKALLLTTLGVLALGSLAIGVAPDLLTLHGIRFVIGLAHGVFMAVASNVAVKCVPADQSGRALALVWLGLTLSVALGVPLGTYLGGVWSWRLVFVAIGALGLLSSLGLVWLMPRAPATPAGAGALAGLRAALHRQLLMAAALAMLVSVATFAFFTFVSPYLLHITAVSHATLSLAMLLFGGCSILGNMLGGQWADRYSVTHCLYLALGALALDMVGLYLWREQPWVMLLLVGLLGVLFFAIVTLSTLRLLRLANHYIPRYSAVAAGLNIASFNLGTAIGGAASGVLIHLAGLAWVPLLGALAALAAMALLWAQGRWLAPQEHPAVG